LKKTYIITFSITIIVLLTVSIVALMVLLPQQSTVLDSSIAKYDSIKKSDYVYEQTKDLTRDALVKEYTITDEQMDKFRTDNKYVSGNSDPFTPNNVITNNNGNNSNNNNNSNSNNNNNSNSSSVNNNSNTSNSTTQKITNSNGGQANPPSTNK